jgi:hypothetical protein
MEHFGGRIDLQRLYGEVSTLRNAEPSDHYKSVVRATIQAHSTDAKSYIKGNPDVFEHVGRGIWGLRPDWLARLVNAYSAKGNDERLDEIAFANVVRDATSAKEYVEAIMSADIAKAKAIVAEKKKELIRDIKR